MPRRAPSAGRTALAGAGSLLLLAAALAAGFGWLDLLRAGGLLHLGPGLPDALPLRRLAGVSAQPLARVLVAFVLAGLVAGFVLSRLTRLARAGRAGLLLLGSLALLVVASQVVYGIQESEGLGATLSRLPGTGVLLEAAFAAAAGAIPAPRPRRR